MKLDKNHINIFKCCFRKISSKNSVFECRLYNTLPISIIVEPWQKNENWVLGGWESPLSNILWVLKSLNYFPPSRRGLGLLFKKCWYILILYHSLCRLLFKDRVLVQSITSLLMPRPMINWSKYLSHTLTTNLPTVTNGLWDAYRGYSPSYTMGLITNKLTLFVYNN